MLALCDTYHLFDWESDEPVVKILRARRPLTVPKAEVEDDAFHKANDVVVGSTSIRFYRRRRGF